MEILGLIHIPTWLLLIIGAVVLVLWYLKLKMRLFEKLGIPGPKPLPLFGNMLDMFKGEGLKTLDQKYKKQFGNTVGIYMLTRPCVMVFDQEMISQVTVKQFQYFINRRSSESGDPLLDSMLTALKDDHWKHVRSMMSPTFTTGKLRQMASEINRCAKQLAEAVGSSGGPFDIRKTSGNYTMDVIASTAFGLRVDSQTSENCDFVVNGNKVMNISFKNPALWLVILFPKLMKYMVKYLGVGILDKKALKFFAEVARQTIDSRTDQDKSRSDFIQLMKNLQQGENIQAKEDEHEVEKLGGSINRTGLTESEILSNAIIFFMAGFDTTMAALQMLFYNLALNPECQERLAEEIDSVMGNKEDVSYDDVSKMPYLEQCLNESLRMYPPAPRVDRQVERDITINGVQFKKDMLVLIPIQAMHYDPEIYPEPYKFDPNRFSPEEKGKRNPITWLPFGFGPRNCIGMRLAIYEMKVAVIHILKKHKVVTCEKTEEPIEWQKGKWLKPKNGIWLAAEKRK